MVLLLHSLSNGELYTIVTNRDKHGREGCLVAIVAGTRSLDVCKVLDKIDEKKWDEVDEVTREYPDIKKAYGLSHSLWMIFAKNTVKDAARLSLAKWYNKVAEAGFHSFNVIAATFYEHYDDILNFYIKDLQTLLLNPSMRK